MFDKQYRFRGSHAERVTKLTSQFESISGTKVFERNVDVLCDAPLIGFLYNRRADLDNTKNPTTNEVYNTNVMGDRVIYSSEEMLFNFRLIMLLDSAYEHDAQKRIHYGVMLICSVESSRIIQPTYRGILNSFSTMQLSCMIDLYSIICIVNAFILKKYT